MGTCVPIDKKSPSVSLSAEGEMSQCSENQNERFVSVWSLDHLESLLPIEMAVQDGSGVSGHFQS